MTTSGSGARSSRGGTATTLWQSPKQDGDQLAIGNFTIVRTWESDNCQNKIWGPGCLLQATKYKPHSQEGQLSYFYDQPALTLLCGYCSHLNLLQAPSREAWK